MLYNAAYSDISKMNSKARGILQSMFMTFLIISIKLLGQSTPADVCLSACLYADDWSSTCACLSACHSIYSDVCLWLCLVCPSACSICLLACSICLSTCPSASSVCPLVELVGLICSNCLSTCPLASSVCPSVEVVRLICLICLLPGPLASSVCPSVKVWGWFACRHALFAIGCFLMILLGILLLFVTFSWGLDKGKVSHNTHQLLHSPVELFLLT